MRPREGRDHPGSYPHHTAAERIWTVQLLPRPGGARLRCTPCGLLAVGTAATRRGALAHLAEHARRAPLPHHLRTCRCCEDGCRWHGRHRGCEGTILLTLTRRGRTWRLADVCRSCAAHTPYSAPVPEPALRPRQPEAASDAWENAFAWEVPEAGAWWTFSDDPQLTEPGP